MPRFGLKFFRHEGCNTYLLFDTVSKQAAVLDPNFETLEGVREYLGEFRLNLKTVLETHTHADHFSSSHILRDQLKAEIAMSKATRSERVTRKLAHGEKIDLGGLSIRALESPGHTPDSLCYEVEGDGVRAVFTGDTLLIGSTGRTDFPGADAKALWTSLHEVIGKFPDSTLIYPGHDYNDIIFTTLRTEREKNPHFQIADPARFAAMKADELLSGGGDRAEIEKRIRFNLARTPEPPSGSVPGAGTQCGASMQESQSTATTGSINVEKYAAKLKSQAADQLYIDVREESEFAEGHPAGAKNVPQSQLGFHLEEIRGAKRIYVSCLSGRRSLMAAKTLAYLGHPDVVNVSGGYKAWLQAGLPTEK